MSEFDNKQWILVKQRISKGDLAFEDELAVFDNEQEAKQQLETHRQQVSATWPDFDDYCLKERVVAGATKISAIQNKRRAAS